MARSINTKFITALVLFICAFDAGANNANTVNSQFNIYCPYSSTGRILVNTYSYEFAIEDTVSETSTLYLETILVEPQEHCEKCYSVLTSANIPESKLLYLISLNLKPRRTIEMFDASLEDEIHPMLPKTDCYKNPDFFEGRIITRIYNWLFN